MAGNNLIAEWHTGWRRENQLPFLQCKSFLTNDKQRVFIIYEKKKNLTDHFDIMYIASSFRHFWFNTNIYLRHEM